MTASHLDLFACLLLLFVFFVFSPFEILLSFFFHTPSLSFDKRFLLLTTLLLLPLSRLYGSRSFVNRPRIVPSPCLSIFPLCSSDSTPVRRPIGPIHSNRYCVKHTWLLLRQHSSYFSFCEDRRLRVHEPFDEREINKNHLGGKSLVASSFSFSPSFVAVAYVTWSFCPCVPEIWRIARYYQNYPLCLVLRIPSGPRIMPLAWEYYTGSCSRALWKISRFLPLRLCVRMRKTSMA